MALNIVDHIDDRVKIDHVLVSVSDKTGLDNLIARLVEINPDIMIYSTGGTYRAIGDALGAGADKNLMQVSDYTGQPETQGGLVKTLDFKIYLGLLTETYNQDHQNDLNRVEGVAIDMIVVNLYPFTDAMASFDATPEKVRTHIDIGGPCMMRAAAKNFLRVASVTDVQDYDVISKELETADGCLSLNTRFALARKAFAHTASYDTSIVSYLSDLEYDDVATCYELS